jgi:hypothetical protein
MKWEFTIRGAGHPMSNAGLSGRSTRSCTARKKVSSRILQDARWPQAVTQTATNLVKDE